MDAPQKTIYLTGHTGFVGTNLFKYLSTTPSYKVIPLNLRDDLSNIDLVEKSCVIHLAGKAHDIKNSSNAEEYVQVNYELTRQLYDVFLKSKAEKFIFISSVKAVADSIEEPLTEEVEAAPSTVYGKSKLMAENYIKSQPLPAYKVFYILRPCMIHGPGNKGNLNLFFTFVSTGLPYPLAAFTNKRSFLSVENLCFILKEFIQASPPTGTYNVADDDSLSTTEVFAILAKALNKQPRYLRIPKSFIVALAKTGDRFNLKLNSDRLKKLTDNYIVDNKKIKQALKKELPLSASEGMLKTARSFKDD